MIRLLGRCVLQHGITGGIHLLRLPPSLISIIKRLAEKAIISTLKARQNTGAVIQDLSAAQTTIDWAVTENLFTPHEATLNGDVDVYPSVIIALMRIGV